MKKKVVLGMSGGVDSFASAFLLKEKGYDVIGITFKFFSATGDSECSEKKCCGVLDIKDAFKSCAVNDIKHYVINLEKEFREKVVNYFINNYLEGKTPNPCIICNREIKFPYLEIWREKLNADFIATGHYTNLKIISDKNESSIRLSLAEDKFKDQTYFLSMVDKKYLQKAIFPLANLKKEWIKDYVKTKYKRNFVESQDICFITGKDYRKSSFLNENFYKKGNIYSSDGKLLGEHQGICNYTIGQRKGFGSFGGKKYIIGIDYKKNKIIIGDKEEAMKKTILISDINYFSKDIINNKVYSAQIRYSKDFFNCFLEKQNDKILVKFEKNVFAPTPGQVCAIYDNDTLICAGFIEKAE